MGAFLFSSHGRWAVGVVALVCVGLVVSCGKGEAKGGEAGPERIVYYCWDDPGYRAIIDAFNESQKEIFVDAQYMSNADYEVKITTLLTGQTEMDAYMQKRQADMFPHERSGFIEPLDGWFKKTGANRSGVDAYLNAVSVDGKVYAIPFRGAGYYVYYNRTIFEKAGVPTPDVYVDGGTWTWEKFQEAAKKISSGDGNVYGASVYFWGASQMIREAQAQRNFITEDGKIEFDDNYFKFLRMRKEMETDKSMWPLVDMKVTSTHYSKQFFDGRVGMLIIGEWFPGQLAKAWKDGIFKGFGWEDWGITRVPCDVEPYVTMGAPTFNHVAAHSKHKEAAFKFIAWMGDSQAARSIAEGGILPAVVDDEVKAVLAQSIPDRKSLEYFTEAKISFPIGMNKYGSAIEGFTERSIVENYLLGKIPDAQFDAKLRSGLEEIIKTTD